MINKKMNVFTLCKKIEAEAKGIKPMNTGLLGEQIIISAYNQMTSEQLIAMKKIIDRLIQKKQEFKKVQNG